MSSVTTSPERPDQLPWTSGMAPAYIGAFLWVAFLDKIGLRALPVGGLIPALAGVAVAAVLAYLLLYRVPALWGFSAGRPLDEVAESTFGHRGALAVPNLVAAFGQVILFTLAIGYGAGWMLDGLQVLGLLEARTVLPVTWGGTVVPSPLFLTTALVWGVVTSLVGMGIVRWIAAIMRYFPVFPAAGLALAVAGSWTGLGDFQPSRLDPMTGLVVAVAEGWRLAFLTTFQWTFAFSALLGIIGADWGAASASVTDVRRGGVVSLMLAPLIIASLTLLAVAGNDGKHRVQNLSTVPESTVIATEVSAGPIVNDSTALVPADRTNGENPYQLRAAIEGSLDPRLAGAILIVFGLASLAPACYAAFEFGRRLSRLAPNFSKLGWTLIGVASAWFLLVGGWHERTAEIFTVLGALYAPIAGAMVADASRQRSADWPGPRAGISKAGLLAWAVGALVGLTPLSARLLGIPTLGRLAPAALFAFIAAFLVYRITAALRLEPERAVTPDPSRIA